MFLCWFTTAIKISIIIGCKKQFMKDFSRIIVSRKKEINIIFLMFEFDCRGSEKWASELQWQG